MKKVAGGITCAGAEGTGTRGCVAAIGPGQEAILPAHFELVTHITTVRVFVYRSSRILRDSKRRYFILDFGYNPDFGYKDRYDARYYCPNWVNNCCLYCDAVTVRNHVLTAEAIVTADNSVCAWRINDRKPSCVLTNVVPAIICRFVMSIARCRYGCLVKLPVFRAMLCGDIQREACNPNYLSLAVLA